MKCSCHPTLSHNIHPIQSHIHPKCCLKRCAFSLVLKVLMGCACLMSKVKVFHSLGPAILKDRSLNDTDPDWGV